MLHFKTRISNVRRIWTAALLSLVLLATLLPVRADAESAGKIVRVGLNYGSGALPTANLANDVGSGYRFGTYAKDGTFTALGATEDEKITVCKDTNLYLSGGSFYETPTSAAYTLIGAYHLQLSGTYAGFDEAKAAASAYPGGFPALVNGSYVVRFEFYSSAANAAADTGKYPGASVVGASATCYTVVDTATGAILFEFDNGGDYFGVQPAGADPTQTWFKGYQYYGGFQYARRNGNDLTVVNFVPEDLYVIGVMPNEFVCSGGIESLKAGAVAIRTFSRVTTKHASAYGFDVCSTDDCQVYRGVYTGLYAAAVKEAAAATAGQCLYSKGVLIQALYFSSDGGATEDAANAWGGAYSYLTGKADPYEATISFSGQSWSYSVTPEQVKAMLTARGVSCGTIVGLKVTETTPSGNANEITITDSDGKVMTYQHDNVRVLRNISGIRYFSRHFTIAPVGASQTPASSGSGFSVYDGSTTTQRDSVTVLTASGKTTVSSPATVVTGSGTSTMGSAASSGTASSGTGWVISGGGYGHNVGMSQWGAYAMAKQGMSYQDILKFYYTGVTVQ